MINGKLGMCSDIKLNPSTGLLQYTISVFQNPTVLNASISQHTQIRPLYILVQISPTKPSLGQMGNTLLFMVTQLIFIGSSFLLKYDLLKSKYHFKLAGHELNSALWWLAEQKLDILLYFGSFPIPKFQFLLHCKGFSCLANLKGLFLIPMTLPSVLCFSIFTVIF